MSGFDAETPADHASTGESGDRPGPTADVVLTLRDLGRQLHESGVKAEVPPDSAPLAEPAAGVGVDGLEQALLAALGMDAVIDTNATVSPRSLNDFLR